MIDIYFDMDGVLANFNKAANKIQKDRGENKSFNECSEEDKAKKKEFWKKVAEKGKSFWTEMEEIKGMASFLGWLSCKRDVRLFVLSSLPITNSAAAEEGKREWIEEHFPEVFHKLYFTTKAKGIFANRFTDILIDDRDSNLISWKLSDGTGIKFTSCRQLHKDFSDVIDHFRKYTSAGIK